MSLNISQHIKSTASQELGFGDHSNPTDKKSFTLAKTIYKIALAILITGFIASAVALITILVPPLSIPVVSSVPFLLAASGSSGTFALLASIHYHSKKSAFAGIMNAINQKIVDPPLPIGKWGATSSIACEDTIESFEWKKKLIESAVRNIVISGNYCGGNSFDEVLQLLEGQLAKKPNLRCVLLSSDKFINEKNHAHIKRLQEKYPQQFQLIETPDIWHLNPGLKKTTNHSKILTIDDGRYFILGGSGLEDKYAYAKGLGDRGKEAAQVGGLLGMVLPRGFRDQDFVFSSKERDGIGRRLYIESLKLALRWEGLASEESFSTDESLKESFLESTSVAKQLLLSETEEKPPENQTDALPPVDIAEFDNSERLSHGKTKLFFSGPEHTTSSFEKEIFEQISKAKERIVIDHMYFHPTERILTALAEAAERGVKIVLITNGFYKRSPMGHKLFGFRNRHNYYYLADRVSPQNRKNLDIREFEVDKTTLHKKMMIIDDKVIGGSGNLGYKSLVTMSDHEVNFVTESQELADQAYKIAMIDGKTKEESEPSEKKNWYAKKIKNPQKSPSLKTIIRSAAHRLWAPLIG